MWGDPTLLIDFSRHNNEQDVASNIVQIQTILEVKTENLVIQSVSCLAALLKHTMMYYLLVWQADLFPVPFLFLSPNSQPSDSPPP